MVEGAIWPKLYPDAKDWLVQPCKKEEYHQNIKKLQLCLFVMPSQHLLHGNVCNDNKYY